MSGRGAAGRLPATSCSFLVSTFVSVPRQYPYVVNVRTCSSSGILRARQGPRTVAHRVVFATSVARAPAPFSPQLSKSTHRPRPLPPQSTLRTPLLLRVTVLEFISSFATVGAHRAAPVGRAAARAGLTDTDAHRLDSSPWQPRAAADARAPTVHCVAWPWVRHQVRRFVPLPPETRPASRASLQVMVLIRIFGGLLKV